MIIKFQINLLSVILLVCWCFVSQAQIQPVGCYNSSGGFQDCGTSWISYQNGEPYNCTCNCSMIPPYDCKPAGSSGSSGGTIPGQTNPGDISSGNIMEGKALFVTHQSDAFTSWAESYKQLLASYGIISILGQNITPNMPSTGNKDWDSTYKNKCDSFNPKVIKPKEKPMVVQPLTTQAQQAARDKWYNDHIKDQGYNNLSSISSKDGIDPKKPSSWDENSTENQAFNQMTEGIGGHPLGKLPAYIANTISSLGSEVFSYLDGVAEALGNGTIDEYASEHPNPGQEAVATVFGNQTVNQATGLINDVGSEAITTSGETVMNSIAGESGVEDFNDALGVINSIQETSDNINNAQTWMGSLFNGND